MNYDHNLFVDAYLLEDEINAIYVDENTVWIYKVLPLNEPGKYYLNRGGIILGENYDMYPVDLINLVKVLKDISIYEYFLNDYSRTEDIDFNILKKIHSKLRGEI